MSDIQKAIDILSDQTFALDDSKRWAMDLAISALTTVDSRRSDIAALFDEVRETEHEMLASIYDPEKADEQLAARRERAMAYAELKRRNLLTYYKLYDFAMILNGDADSILDMVAMNILLPPAIQEGGDL